VDLGRNGTYLVFRKLQQHVEQFWHYFDQQARQLMRAGVGPKVDCSAEELDAWVDWLAAKSIGRWRSGAPLVKSPDHEDPSKAGASVVNKFSFRGDNDLHGDACPNGSHIRRANPRDAREPDTSTAEDSRTVVRRHRVLRRGRSWGPPMDRLVARTGVPDGNRRGLLFICLQASIARGFEFVQQTWLSNLGFGGLAREGDPLAKGEVDPKGSAHDGFTIPAYPIRIRLHGMPRFVSTLGGEYFFVPSISALNYFAQ
jgi:Dyp-type peroxidase family